MTLYWVQILAECVWNIYLCAKFQHGDENDASNWNLLLVEVVVVVISSENFLLSPLIQNDTQKIQR